MREGVFGILFSGPLQGQRIPGSKKALSTEG